MKTATTQEAKHTAVSSEIIRLLTHALAALPNTHRNTASYESISEALRLLNANARLIAPAPDLLAALIVAESVSREAMAEAHRLNAAANETVFNPAVFQLLRQVMNEARAALAKAEGTTT